jgi:hypothetical protein
MPALTVLMLSPAGNRTIFAIWSLCTTALGLVFLPSLPLSLGALIFLLSRKHRQAALKILYYSSVTCLVVGFSIRNAYIVRDAAFTHLAESSKPLVDAVSAYDRKYGKPPGQLEQLVPEFLPKVPGTGMGAYPAYEYRYPVDDKRYGPWELSVPCSIGLLNWDIFFYWPSKNYPDHTYGGYTKKIGDWAYVHE